MVAYNIVFAGETGVGKSSLINLLFDLEVSPTSNDILGVTDERKRFIAVQDGDVYRLWDTPGLNEGTHGNVLTRQAMKELESLFKELEAVGDVHLLVFCFRFTKYFTTGLQRVFESVMASIHGSQVPIVAAVTHADEMRQTPESWWNLTESQRQQKELIFADYACVSTLEDEDYPPTPGRREKAKHDMWRLIKNRAKPLLPDNSLPKEVNVILFGQTGVGKSSVVNLIAGRPVAEVSPDAEGCTMSSTEYRFVVGAHDFRIWDTVGLEEPAVGMNTYFGAILKALQLIRGVAAAGGINLLLFCMPGRRVTKTVQSNYRLFYEMLCESKVPIGLVITNLEREKDMEDWWMRNKRALHDHGIKSVGHACVTGLPYLPEKYALSRAAIYGLLTDCDRFGKYIMPPEIWFKRVARNMKSLVTGGSLPKGEKLTQALLMRGGLKEDDARRLRKCLEEPEHEGTCF
ncbi:P-loop containing nucleoside triphosphate hydrolase protein [Pisolithus orientalis]|uniref:P-loop containing nucleoside triphosphate hydrolase protein n=1 Tax=Pisolithus orientalis TaxID=936130 RepID=UPI002224E0D1|nr:P-loop containing nucleoside triphosphate hydrolase protein [Pisolithus orientalis]KAI6030463.1 P-loop containing nucleoside triphosphate hydrolase protein [Pisolithus orientalis]